MEEKTSTLKALYRVFRWVLLIVLFFVIFAFLRKPAPVAPETPPETVQVRAQEFDAKVQQLADAHGRGESSEARFSADEVNAAITRTMQEPAPPQNVSAPSTSTESQPQPNLPPATAEATPGTAGGAPIRTVQVAFQGDEVTGQFATELYGKQMYITLAGRLGSKNGYATFDLTGFKVGNFSVPISLVGETFQQKLAEPENHEKLKLPDFIASLRVENGELVITQK